jgi:excisionase family DNA binding protein
MPRKKIEGISSSAPVAHLLVDIPTAARLLSTTVWQIRELCWAKKLPYIKLGRKWLFTPASLEAFVRKQAGAA